jgi:hypothetical protein
MCSAHFSAAVQQRSTIVSRGIFTTLGQKREEEEVGEGYRIGQEGFPDSARRLLFRGPATL